MVMIKLFKRTAKYAGYVMLSVLCLLIMYLGTAFCLSRITVSKEDGTTSDVTIYIKTNGVHTDIVVPAKNELRDWSKELRYSNANLRDTTTIQWLALGWGDKGFYLNTPTWDDLKFSTAFNAAFALGGTAMHATYYNELSESKSCKKIEISSGQYRRLINYLDKSFEKDTAGNLVHIKTNANYGNNDAFYEATGRYSMFKTCNSWANDALKSCGQKACAWTAFDTGIFLKYQ